MADETVAKIGTMLEELRTRFELVIEAISGFGGKFDGLRQEIVGQFAEVGAQIRFLTDQIAENRRGIQATRSELGAEMVRLGEAIGRTRVEFREEVASARAEVRGDIARAATIGDGRGATDEFRRELAETAKALKKEIAASGDTATRRLSAELKQAAKALANLNRKFDRFDDRVTIETKDQDQRLKKLERRTRG
ncbi:MAG: hypothetical protein ACREQF_10270 [Candidatus Binataceae bacterium]